MSAVIKTNMSALRTYNLLNANQSSAQKHMLKVSTGMKLNSAQDDASAYSISERMRVRIRALEQAHQNTQNGSSMIKTAEGAVSNILETLRTLKEKAIDAANDSNTDEDRRIMQKEFNQFVDQIDDDALTQFNSMYLINNSRNNAFKATWSIMSNHNLAKDTDFTTAAFSSLKTRFGESLGIKDTDTIAWSYVENGKTYHGEIKGSKTFFDLHADIGATPLSLTIFSSTGSDKVAIGDATHDYRDKFDSKLYTSQGVMFISPTTEAKNYISGITLQVRAADGTVNKFANAYLKFTEENRGESQTGDRALSFHVGAEANQATKVALTDMRTEALGLKGNKGNIISISTKDDANAAISAIDTVIKKVLDEQSNIGAFLSRLEYTAANLTTSYTNDTASESVIRDADMATETASYVKYNVLSQSAQAMLAQANQNPRNVLSLLR